MQTHDLDFFQLDNLIRNRVPFCFFNYGTPLKNHYQLLEKIHLNTWLIDVSSHSEIESQIKERQLPTHSGIIILCQDGNLSRHSQELLLKNGYSNVYIVHGGYENLKDSFGKS